ncbi:MAG: hypothetical protein ABSH28_13695 [Acidobacteriota bacterium]|jgi:hypothetical protein
MDTILMSISDDIGATQETGKRIPHLIAHEILRMQEPSRSMMPWRMAPLMTDLKASCRKGTDDGNCLKALAEPQIRCLFEGFKQKSDADFSI